MRWRDRCITNLCRNLCHNYRVKIESPDVSWLVRSAMLLDHSSKAFCRQPVMSFRTNCG